MPRFFGWLRQQSSNDRLDTSEDISFIYSKKANPLLNDEITVHVAQYLQLTDLYSFSRVDSSSLKLLFNYQNGSKHKKKQTVIKSIVDYEKDESLEFERVQHLIWKPLVLAYFPNFGQSLNIKNWMHVLRRRIKHINIHNTNNNFKIQVPHFATSKDDAQFIENCEWIYKCPLRYDELEPSKSKQVKHCHVCNKDVHLVDDMKQFKHHVGKGDCVVYSTKASGNEDDHCESPMGSVIGFR